MSRRKERKREIEEFLGQSVVLTGSSISLGLMESAAVLLRKARTEGEMSRHVPGCVLLLATALDAQVNDWVLTARAQKWQWDQDVLKQIADDAFARKMRKLPEALGAAAPSYSDNLQLLSDLRDEIAHHFGRDFPGEKARGIFNDLDKRGLLVNREGDHDWALHQKLLSVALGEWAFSTASDAVDLLVLSCAGLEAEEIIGDWNNFRSFFEAVIAAD